MQKRVIDGNEACANISYMFTESAGVYPITPSTPMVEYMEKYALNERKNLYNEIVDLKEMQSEKGAIALVHGLLQTGTLSSTYTSSQGLLLMIPSMYKIAGEMLPCVINVATRTVGTHALSIFGDHSDIYAVRDTGFSILHSSNVNDVSYMTLISYLSSIDSSMPFINSFDGFRTSHELSKVDDIKIEDVKKLVDFKKIDEYRMGSMLSKKQIKGTVQNDDIYFQNLEVRNSIYEKLPDIVNLNMEKVNKKFKTNYKPFNYYGDKKAEKIIVAMGSVCESIKELIDILNEKDEKVGLIEVHLFRPFSKKYFFDVMPKSVRKIAVLDMSNNPSSFDVLYSDIVNIFNDVKNKPFIVGGRYGISSKNTNLEDLYAVYKNLDKKNPINSFTIGIDDDKTNKSLKKVKIKSNKKNIEMLIYGFGSDGMISASKDIIKIIGNNTEGYVQGYFQYDSKKSGGVTKSHLRIGKEEVRNSYYIESPHIVVCSKEEYIKKYDVLSGMRKNGIFILVTNKNEEELYDYIPDNVKSILSSNNVKMYTIDAYSIASKCNIANKISTIMEYAILDITKLYNIEEAKKIIISNIQKYYKNKGEEIVNNNIEALEYTLNNIKEINVLSTWKNLNKVNKETKDLNEKISLLKGNELKLSEFSNHLNGSYEVNKSDIEKRDIARNLPCYLIENCIQCNRCSILCPHGVIVPKLLDDDEIKKNKNIIYTAALGNDKYKYALEIKYENCTGCGICAENCPGKAGAKALVMRKREEVDRINNLVNASNKKVFSGVSLKGLAFNEPLFRFSGACAGCGETPYLKLLTLIFGEGMIVANATGCSSIYGGDINNPYNISWSNSLFEDNAEYGLGMAVSVRLNKEKISNIMKEKLKGKLTIKNIEMFNKYLKNKDSYKVTKEVMENINYDDASELISLKECIPSKSVWVVGGDGWSYDIDFDGIDHLMSSNENVNILVLDTEIYSNTGGQSSKSTSLGATSKFDLNGKKTTKKDLARMMMTYKNAYVAQISLGADINQSIKAIREANNHNGPSLIIAYSPCISHGIKSGMKDSITEEKLAVESGYFPIFRNSPETGFTLDYKNVNFDLYDELINNEVRFNKMSEIDKKESKKLLDQNKQDIIDRYNYYKSLENKTVL